MPASPDEQARIDKLVEYAQEANAGGETEPTLGPSFLVKLVVGFVALRDRVASNTAAIKALDDRVKLLERPPSDP